MSGSSRSERAIEFRLGNIAQAECEAIVNPCNRGFLLGHAGVNGAIAAAAGPGYASECAQLPAIARGADALGEVIVTGAGTLQARCVIHAVSPIWRGGDHGEREALRRVHERVLTVASKRGCRSLALPAIGTGAHRFPVEVAASLAVPTVEAVLQNDPRLKRVLFVFQTRATLHDYLVRSSSPDQHGLLVAGLREEITSSLRDAGRMQLAETVDRITDEATLRAIISEGQTISHSAHADESSHSASVNSSTVYVRAVQRVLQLESKQSLRPGR